MKKYICDWVRVYVQASRLMDIKSASLLISTHNKHYLTRMRIIKCRGKILFIFFSEENYCVLNPLPLLSMIMTLTWRLRPRVSLTICFVFAVVFVSVLIHFATFSVYLCFSSSFSSIDLLQGNTSLLFFVWVSIILRVNWECLALIKHLYELYIYIY